MANFGQGDASRFTTTKYLVKADGPTTVEGNKILGFSGRLNNTVTVETSSSVIKVPLQFCKASRKARLGIVILKCQVIPVCDTIAMPGNLAALPLFPQL